MELDLRNQGRHLTIDRAHEAVGRFVIRHGWEPAKLVISSDQDRRLIDEWKSTGIPEPPEETLHGTRLWGAWVAVRNREPAPEPACRESQGPDLIQPVIGFREWDIVDLKLVSCGGAIRAPWETGVNVARCHQDGIDLAIYGNAAPPGSPPLGHDAPHPDCACGLYAYHELEAIDRGSYGTVIDRVVGAVAAWGRIEVHHHGFRAEHAKVVAVGLSEQRVLANSGWRTRVETVAERYGVPAVAVIDLEAAAFEHGIRVPAEMIPEEPEPGPFAGLFASGGHVHPGSLHMSISSGLNVEEMTEAMARISREHSNAFEGLVEGLRKRSVRHPRATE